jgi:hypothetical protein
VQGFYDYRLKAFVSTFCMTPTASVPADSKLKSNTDLMPNSDAQFSSQDF